MRRKYREPLKTKKSEANESEKAEFPIGNQNLRANLNPSASFRAGEGIRSFVEVPYRIIIIGRGNVATHLARVLKTGFTKNISGVDKIADIIILAVKDDVIAEIAKKIKAKNKIVVHTSGSTDMGILKKCSANYGVLYPLQTISKERKINWKEVPICIEASDKKTEKILFSIGKSFSKNVYKINSSQRKILHMAAVFACNFTNHMYAIAEDILKTHHISFDLLKPLITETANKILEMNSAEAQTGPAKRNDKKIMQEHLKLLADKNYRNLYKLISKSIQYYL